MTIARDAPISNSSGACGTTDRCPASVLRGLMYSTGARGGPLYGGAWTASPKAVQAARSFSNGPSTVPERRQGAKSNAHASGSGGIAGVGMVANTSLIQDV